MTTSTQTQLRRGTASQIALMTPAAGEAIVDTTNNRLNIGDSVTAGGKLQASANDVQKQSFVFPTVGGSGDVITLANIPAVTAYAAGLKQVFKASAANTTAVTVNVDGLGAKNVKKMNNGALAALVANDIISGGIYEIFYDGTQFQIKGLAEGPYSDGATSIVTPLSGGSVAVTVDFTKYAAYAISVVGVTTNVTGGSANLIVSASSDGGSTYVTATRVTKRISGTTLSATSTYDMDALDTSVPGQMSGVVTQPSTSGSAGNVFTAGVPTATAAAWFGSTNFATSAAINKLKVSSSATFTAGYLVLTPLGLR